MKTRIVARIIDKSTGTQDGFIRYVQANHGYRFVPTMSGRKGSAKHHQTMERAIPAWARRGIREGYKTLVDVDEHE